MTRVTHLNTAVPEHALPQTLAAQAVSRSLGLSEGRHQSVVELFGRAQVDRRFSVMDSDSMVRHRGLSQNMDLYRQHAADLGERAARPCLELAGVRPEDIDLIVTCSCTGLLLPSLSVLVAEKLGLRRDVRRIPITEAGCAGGASALARADEFIRAFPKARALVLAVELPTLTLQHHDHSSANLIASAIFGDGAAAAVVQGGRDSAASSSGVEIVATHSELLPSSVTDLGFDLRDGGLHIVLSREVPRVISNHLPRIIDRFLEEQGLSREDLSFFVMHPGGRKVLDSVEECLGLEASATQVSRDVLRAYGNQSSASVLFVLQQTFARGTPRGYGLLAAFGPGITVELSLLRGAQ